MKSVTALHSLASASVAPKCSVEPAACSSRLNRSPEVVWGAVVAPRWPPSAPETSRRLLRRRARDRRLFSDRQLRHSSPDWRLLIFAPDCDVWDRSIDGIGGQFARRRFEKLQRTAGSSFSVHSDPHGYICSFLLNHLVKFWIKMRTTLKPSSVILIWRRWR